ncbi:MAG: arylamine N-acetyltransferase family protein [Burkholderiaceae bacterium]
MTHLPDYLRRIGYEGPLDTSLDVLQRLHSLHMQSIPFENLSPFTGREVRLDLQSLVEKLVHQKRGGYCYEQNLLFRHVLETLGFRVTSLAARVRLNVPDDVLTPRSHMLLLVHLDGADYVVDTGFGGMTPTAPLQLVPHLAQQAPHGRYRLLSDGAIFRLEVEIKQTWKTLYAFDLCPHYLPDYEVANWYVSRHPASHFTSGLVVARLDRNGRHVLNETGYSYYGADAEPEKRNVGSVAEFMDLLERTFHISTAGLPELPGRLESLLQARRFPSGTQ